MQIKPIEELARYARGYASANLPIETHTSFPIPVRGSGKKKISVIYCPSMLKPTGFYLSAPDHLGHIDAQTAELASLEPVTPMDLGQSHGTHERLGQYDMRRAVKSPEEYHDLLRRLYADYDLLLPHFFAGDSSLPVPAGRAAAEFPAVFRRVNEDVLWPYYERLGKDFFGWLARVARL